MTKGIALALADGISTSRLGAAAAETAVKSFLTDYYCTSAAWSVRTAAERVIAATNSWMHAQNSRHRPREDGEDRERGALICTFSALVLKARAAHLFHVGDARIALIAKGRVEPLTEPHRVELGGGESYLGRALGVNRAVEIDYRQVPLQPGDLFMLSTDGVHEFVGDAETLALIEQADDLAAAARAIAEAALANGSGDNLTVQLLRVDGLPNGEVSDLLGAELGLPPAPQARGRRQVRRLCDPARAACGQPQPRLSRARRGRRHARRAQGSGDRARGRRGRAGRAAARGMGHAAGVAPEPAAAGPAARAARGISTRSRRSSRGRRSTSGWRTIRARACSRCATFSGSSPPACSRCTGARCSTATCGRRTC